MYSLYEMHKSFPFTSLPVDIRLMIETKMDVLTWMNYQLACGYSINIELGNSISIPFTGSKDSDVSSVISEESYDMEKGFSSDED